MIWLLASFDMVLGFLGSSPSSLNVAGGLDVVGVDDFLDMACSLDVVRGQSHQPTVFTRPSGPGGPCKGTPSKSAHHNETQQLRLCLHLCLHSDSIYSPTQTSAHCNITYLVRDGTESHPNYYHIGKSHCCCISHCSPILIVCRHI